MKIALGADHAGFEYKQQLADKLKEQGHQVVDYGTHNADSVDYPDFAHPVANDVSDDKADFGILVCGSANGVAMTANKYARIRAAICWNEELASLSRLHNNANILCIPARFVSYETAEGIMEKFLTSSFEGGRHEKRVDKINC